MAGKATCNGSKQVVHIANLDAIKQHQPFVEGELFGVVMADLCQYVVFLGKEGVRTWPVAIWQETLQRWYGNRSSSTLSILLDVFSGVEVTEPEKLLDIAERGAAVLVGEKMEGAINGK